jgi:pimeloyl-ACP methyl ester carboxylesterase
MGGFDQSLTLGRTIAPPAHRLIAVSRPGYLATPLGVGRTPPEQADAHAALLDTLRIESTIVMAISGGGPSALHFALRHAHRCSRLVLCSTLAGAQEQKVPLFFHVMMALAGFSPFTRALRKKTEQNLAAALSRSISDPALLKHTLKDEAVMELFKVVVLDSFNNMHKRSAGTRCDIAISKTFSCPLEKIAVPTLVVHGDRDSLVPFATHGQQLATRISNARLCLAQGGEHVAIFTHRQQVQKAVHEFLS